MTTDDELDAVWSEAFTSAFAAASGPHPVHDAALAARRAVYDRAVEDAAKVAENVESFGVMGKPGFDMGKFMDDSPDKMRLRILSAIRALAHPTEKEEMR